MANPHEGNFSIDQDRVVPGSRNPGRDVQPGSRDNSRQAQDAGNRSGQSSADQDYVSEGANVQRPRDNSKGQHGGNR